MSAFFDAAPRGWPKQIFSFRQEKTEKNESEKTYILAFYVSES